MELDFLTLDDVVEIHRDQVIQYGGSDGVRDMRLLLSALAMPQAGVGDEYFHANLFEMAAAYLFHIVRNHPFVDGNKRVAAVSAIVFLGLNGLRFEGSEKSLVRITRSAATGAVDKARVAAYFRRYSRRLTR